MSHIKNKLKKIQTETKLIFFLINDFRRYEKESRNKK